MECGAEKNPACPVCSKHLNVLARKLPFAHCAQSRLICAMSGQPLNEHNPPMMLPNGYVYGLNVSTYVYIYQQIFQLCCCWISLGCCALTSWLISAGLHF